MTEFVFHDDVAGDLLKIRVRSSAAEKRILALLETAEEDPVLMQSLQKKQFRTYGTADIEIKGWVTAIHLGYDLHRLRAFYLEDFGFRYRVIYASDIPNDFCYILAIVHRDDINYDDPLDPLNQRIFRAYDSIGL